MDEDVLSATRLSLPAVAEQLLAGPQHRTQGTIRLHITPGGFGQVAGPWRTASQACVRSRLPSTSSAWRSNNAHSTGSSGVTRSGSHRSEYASDQEART